MEVDKIEEKVNESCNKPENDDIVSEKSDKNTQESVNYDNDIPESQSQETFKKPVLIIGPRKGHPTKLKLLSEDSALKAFTDVEEQSNEILKQKPVKFNLDVKPPKDNQISLDYKEPAWSSIPERVYKMEVLKSGVIIEVIDLSSKSYHVVGRLPSCDISMAHPTISRCHAVIQYRAAADEHNEKGMYIYDLGSTHGTFWNGCKIKPKVYVRLQGGHMIRFGCSQRKFILQAPSDDQEPESELSITELKEIRRQELEERERLEKQRLIEKEEMEKLEKEKEESEGIDWGMGEDADEETDLAENPYAQTNNEELFLDDPKKTLRGWFEREGCDLEYHTEDKGVGRFLCWVELPLDNTLGKTVRAEAFVTGKKKEAVAQCALEACRILDRYGVLRQANHEARKRKIRNWEEEDFYDSDEDNFLDRTGTIEKKREHRMRMAGKLETKAETYDSLLEKHSKLVEKIQNIENTLAKQKLKQEQINNSNEDALDAFMSTLDSSTLDKVEIRKMKIDLVNLRKEEMQLLRLINISKPANLPALKPVTVAIKKTTDSKDSQMVADNNKEPRLSSLQKSETVSKPKEDDDNEDLINEKSESEVVEDDVNKSCEETSSETSEISKSKNMNFKISKNETTNSSERSQEYEKETTSKKKKSSKRMKEGLKRTVECEGKGYDEDEFREDYSMWVPPENQSGDGKTSLNQKFGY